MPGSFAAMIINKTQNLVATITQIGAKFGLDVNVANAGNIGTAPAVANAAKPTLVEGTQNPLSEDLSGRLRASPVIAAISGQANIALNVIATTTRYTVPAGKFFRGSVFVNAGTALTAGSTLAISINGASVKGVAIPVTAINVAVLEVQGIFLPSGSTIASQLTPAGGTGTAIISWIGVEQDNVS